MKQLLFRQRYFPTLVFSLIFLLLLAACGSTTSSSSTPTPTPAPKGTVSVAYAASLANIMEKIVKPAFEQSTGYKYESEAKGSSALVNKIKGKLSFPDVFISANPQLDAGFFYINEVKGPNIPYITLPDQVNLGNPSMASHYATVSWKNPKTNAVSKGAPVVYTVTVLNTAKNMAGGIAFANFLLSSQGQALLQGQGVLTTTFTVGGETTAIPQQLQQYAQS